MQQQGPFEASLQVTIPNEWDRIAPINIGYTAGIETNKVSPAWISRREPNGSNNSCFEPFKTGI